MAEQEKINQLEEKVKELEKRLSAKEKICEILTKRVERSIDSVGGAYSIFERNILLQHLVDQRSRELEDANKKLSQEINERVKSEQKLHSVIQGSPIPAFVIGKDHRVLYWNKALEELSSTKADEVIGTRQHWRAFYSKERPCMADLLVDEILEAIPQWYSGKYIKSKLIEGAYEAIDFFTKLGDGGKWLRSTAASIRDSQGDLVGAIESLEDITERKRAEKDLRESEEQARQLAQENAIMAEIGKIIGSTLDIKEVYERFASEARKLISFDRIAVTINNYEENTAAIAYVSGKEVPDRQMGNVLSMDSSFNKKMVSMRSGLLLQTEDIDEVRRQFPSLLTVFQAGFWSMMSVPLVSKDQTIGGLHFWSIQSNAYTKMDLRLAESIGSQIAGAIANAQLFAERQRLEGRLRRAEKMEALGTLAGGVAHDLNNVLGVLVGYSELVLMEIGEGNPLGRHVSYILQSSQRAAAIIQDLLTLARRGVAVPEVVNLNNVISDYFKTPEFEELKAHHPLVTFKSDLDKDVMNIKGSPVHLSKTIMNLLSNAAEAITDRGEVTLVTENRYLDKPITGYDHIQEGDYVVLRVLDNGKGISTKDIGKIFEPFYTKKVMGRSGTGLGLAVVWGTVKDHHGYIDVQSEEGGGSVFTLYFPVTREERVSEEKGVSHESYMGRGESILVVDDVKEQRELATAMLTRLGYQVDAASSGEEAVTYLKTHRVDLLVLDMIMDPGMDGLETYQRVLEINPKQKAIIVSGFSETDRVKKAQELGAGAYVRKPYIREKIGLAIKRELDK